MMRFLIAFLALVPAGAVAAQQPPPAPPAEASRSTLVGAAMSGNLADVTRLLDAARR